MYADDTQFCGTCAHRSDDPNRAIWMNPPSFTPMPRPVKPHEGSSSRFHTPAQDVEVRQIYL
jgi:hypothetical protein